MTEPAECDEFPDDPRHLHYNERRLWAAVMDRAVKDARGQDLKVDESRAEAAVIRKEARRWFEDESLKVGSFLWCCNVLGLDRTAGKIRAAVPPSSYRGPR